jgi:hypothetical protein
MVASLALSCSATPLRETSYHKRRTTAADIPKSHQKDSNILGVWEGTTIARKVSERGRIGSQQIITITLLEGENSTVTGYYTCAYGNQTCLGQNTTGEIMAAYLKGSRISIQVRLPNATTCFFSGRVVNSSVVGGYAVYAGGGIIEQGDWHAQRSY